MNKRVISLFTLIAMVVSLFGAFSAAFASDGIQMSLNGNNVSSNKKELALGDGLFTAKTEGAGLFALGFYKGGELVSLDFAEGDDLSGARLNLVIDESLNTYDDIKLFRFDKNGNPVCVNKTLTPDNTKNIRVYANDTFDSGKSNYTEMNGTTMKITDGRLEFCANSAAIPRYTIPALNHGKQIIFEAEYQLGTADVGLDETDVSNQIRLLNYYYKRADSNNATHGILRMRSGGKVYIGSSQEKDDLVCTLSSEKSTKLSVKMDFEKDTFDVYVDGSPVESAMNRKLLPRDIIESNVYNGRSFSIGYLSNDRNMAANIFVDNVRIYEGTEFIDIGSSVGNVHKTDYSSDISNTTMYERPTADVLAKHALKQAHPRVMLNSQKLGQIKNSTDPRVIEWKQELLANADNELSTQPYAYAVSNTNSIENLGESIIRMMTLGLAYLLEGDTRYSDRAYREAEVLMNYKTEYRLQSDKTKTALFDDWNSRKYLDVGEISFIMAICYDWMYDAWTPGQRQAMADAVMQKGVGLSYKVLHSERIEGDSLKYKAPSGSDSDRTDTSWYDNSNNWNAVCNGGVFVAAMAFMEHDTFVCANVAESTLRGLEYMMATYAPDGAWPEGPTYWGYALKFLTAACATLEASCDTVYGIDKAEGFDNTALFSLALEGAQSTANFGDSGAGHVNAPFMLYWSRVFDKPEYTSAYLYEMQRYDFAVNPFNLIYYDSAYNASSYTPPTEFKFDGAEIVTFKSGLDTDDTFIAISGGPGKMSNHDHLDSGAVIVDMKGQRLFYDIGAEHYNAQGYFGAEKFLHFRARPESHNIFIINPENTTDHYGQIVSAVSEITSYNPATKTATMNLDAAYARDASAASRTFGLDGDNVVIEDSITLRDISNVYWNWYVKTTDGIVISDDRKSAKITLNGIEYDVSFETDTNYTLYTEEAKYYVNVDPDPNGPSHAKKDKEYTRLVLKLEGAAGTVNVKTIVK